LRFKNFIVDGKVYVIDKFITRFMFLVLLLLFLFVWFSSGAGLFQKNIFLSCKDSTRCDNIYYGRYDLKDSSNLPDYVFDMEYLYPGFSVNKPTFLQSNFFSVVCFVVGFFIFLNHFVHNRKLFGFKGLFKELKG